MPAEGKAIKEVRQLAAAEMRERADKAEYELRRWKEVQANKPDWETLWAEILEREERAVAEARRTAAEKMRERAAQVAEECAAAENDPPAHERTTEWSRIKLEGYLAACEDVAHAIRALPIEE